MIPAKPNLGKLKINDNTIEGKKCQLTKKINIAIVISCCEVYAGVVKLADTYDSKSYEVYPSCGFNSHLRHVFRLLPNPSSPAELMPPVTVINTL